MTAKTKVWAQGMEGWRLLHQVVFIFISKNCLKHSTLIFLAYNISFSTYIQKTARLADKSGRLISHEGHLGPSGVRPLPKRSLAPPQKVLGPSWGIGTS